MGLGSLLSLLWVGFTTTRGPKGNVRAQSGSWLPWGAPTLQGWVQSQQPRLLASQTSASAGQIPLSPAYPPGKARMCCFPGDTPSTKACPRDRLEQACSSGPMSWGVSSGQEGGCGALPWDGASTGAPAPKQALELLLPAPVLHHRVAVEHPAEKAGPQ